MTSTNLLQHVFPFSFILRILIGQKGVLMHFLKFHNNVFKIFFLLLSMRYQVQAS
jgi:hypothetical protein